MKLRHPKSGRRTSATDAGRIALLKSQGWVEYREPAKKATKSSKD